MHEEKNLIALEEFKVNTFMLMMQARSMASNIRLAQTKDIKLKMECLINLELSIIIHRFIKQTKRREEKFPTSEDLIENTNLLQQVRIKEELRPQDLMELLEEVIHILMIEVCKELCNTLQELELDIKFYHRQWGQELMSVRMRTCPNIQ